MNDREPDFVDLLANVAHDIKNSLTLILAAADTLAAVPNLPASAQDALFGLQHHGRRVASDMLHLLGVFKLERGRPLLAPTLVDCEELLEEVLAFNRELFAAKGIELRLSCCEPAQWIFDRGLVQGVLNAALDNAYRYARARVELACVRQGGCVVFSVEDDGPGYPPTLLALGESTQAVHGLDSTGLGLYFANRIAGLHEREGRNGRVVLANRPGSRFEIWLP